MENRSFAELKSESPDSTATAPTIEGSASTTATSEDEGLGSEQLMMLRRRRRRPLSDNCGSSSSSSIDTTDGDDRLEDRLQQLHSINRQFLSELERREQLLTSKESLVRGWSLQDTLERRRLAVLDGQLHAVALQLVALEDRTRRLQQTESSEQQNWQNLWRTAAKSGARIGKYGASSCIEKCADSSDESELLLKQLFSNECTRIDRLRTERQQLHHEHNRLLGLQTQLLQQRNDQTKVLLQVRLPLPALVRSAELALQSSFVSFAFQFSWIKCTSHRCKSWTSSGKRFVEPFGRPCLTCEIAIWT
jgi:hypothetical protein